MAKSPSKEIDMGFLVRQEHEIHFYTNGIFLFAIFLQEFPAKST